MKRELRFLPSARAGMPELAGAGDRFVKRREPSHPALRAAISRVGWSPGVPFGMETASGLAGRRLGTAAARQFRQTIIRPPRQVMGRV
jgi:hypothetical protein